MTTPVSETIFASRDAIRDQVIEYLQQYMELNEVDLTQSSFLSYVIDIFTNLASNLMFYQSNIYKEFFLTQAQLPESIHNLSAFLGYSPSEASYSVANVLMTVPLPFDDPDTSFEIPSGFEFQTSDGVVFISHYDIDVTVTNSSSVSISASEDGKIITVPYNIDTTSDDMYFQFIIPVEQYKTTTQEIGIDDDLQPYQFTDIDVPIDGKLSSLEVYVRDPDASTDSDGRLYTKFDSLYLMSSSDYGYVMRVSSEGRKLYFGNGIIGQQPLAGSTVVVYVNETEGADGNVITGSITSGERIYTQQDGETQIVSYSVTNASPAYDGADEESLQEIRSNSIKSLTSLNRLVSEEDYQNFDVIVPDAPIKSNSIPVLKRSDLKVNEIQLYTIFEFGDDIVPSVNGMIEVPSTTTYLAREQVTEIDDIEYITLFDMSLDQMNEAAYYHYVMREITLVPTLIESWTYDESPSYDFNVNSLVVSIDDSTSEAVFELSYYSTEDDYSDCECTMTILSTDDSYEMVNVPGTGGGKFVYVFSDYLDLPKGSDSYYFLISNPATVNSLSVTQANSQYSSDFVVRKDLKSYMMSNTVDDGTTTIIYDIPMIKKSYYDSIDQVVFETQVLQTFISAFDLKDYRMLTDFNNIKLSNSTGVSKNMLLNDTTKSSIKEIGRTSIPTDAEIGDRYIVSGNEGGLWNSNRDNIAMCIYVDATSSANNTYTFLEPKDNDIVYVTNKDSNYIYSELGWRQPLYDIPLKISIEVFKEDDSSVDDNTLVSNIKTALVEYYTDIFGVNIDIRRSKIIDLVHDITGVSYCRLLKPETGIFFDFDIDDFTQQQLLEYSPEWMHFTEDDITIKTYTLD